MSAETSGFLFHFVNENVFAQDAENVNSEKCFEEICVIDVFEEIEIRDESKTVFSGENHGAISIVCTIAILSADS